MLPRSASAASTCDSTTSRSCFTRFRNTSSLSTRSHRDLSLSLYSSMFGTVPFRLCSPPVCTCKHKKGIRRNVYYTFKHVFSKCVFMIFLVSFVFMFMYEGTSKSFRTLFIKNLYLCYKHENNVTFQYNLPSSQYI